MFTIFGISRRSFSFISKTVFQSLGGSYRKIYQPKRQCPVRDTIPSQRKFHGLSPLQLHTLFTIPQPGYGTGQYMPILADTFLIFELWVCGADDFGDSCERMETLHLGLGSERENSSAVLNSSVFGFPGRPGTPYRFL